MPVEKIFKQSTPILIFQEIDLYIILGYANLFVR
jgi:hypothetical protein